MTATPTTFVIREFPDMGKYKVRLMQTLRDGRATKTWLDVREYASGPNYMGFTRRGVRIMNLEEARLLREALDAIERDKVFE